MERSTTYFHLFFHTDQTGSGRVLDSGYYVPACRYYTANENLVNIILRALGGRQ